METDTTDATQVDEPINANDNGAIGTDALAESSPASEENHEQKQDGVQKRINTLTAKKYEAERESERLRAENAALKAEKPVVVDNKLDVPKFPDDVYDQEAMQKYHQSMVTYTNDAANAASDRRFADNQQAAQEASTNAQVQKTVSTYANNAVRDGIDMDKLRVVDQTLNNAGISAELGNYLMQDTNGAKVAEYLSDNPALMHEVFALSPAAGAVKIATEIKALALASTPKVSNAPEPHAEITGGGFTEKDDFDKNYPDAVFI